MLKIAAWTTAALLMAAVLLGLAWKVTKVNAQSEWNQWVLDVQIACQPGADEGAVMNILGRSPQIKKPEDVVDNGALRPRIPQIDGAEKVLVYPGPSGLLNGFWTAFVFIGSDGKVLAYRLAYT